MTNNSIDTKVTNNADGFDIAGGTTARKLTLSAGDVAIAGSGTAVITFPSSTSTLATLGLAQTFTAANSFNSILDVNNPITASSNAATVPVTYRLNTITNNAAGTVAITMTVTNAVDGQLTLVRFYDYSAAAQTLSWVNTENSNAVVPTTSNGSTTLPVTVGFQYNGQTSLWRCLFAT